ncbi:SH3 domain-containing protein [Aureimonas sp. Leaf454]|uniref:SH3 domain-containing protein n=1 Tax=Aureimonas sp. Leaf454 TaxID=1736381 RepID=UPI00138F25C4|nr:SH3 domain-containing protein [Aureimonas sp. Leaf454]
MIRALQFIGSAVIVAAAWSSSPAHAASAVPGEEHCVVDVAANDALNLRKAPSASAKVLAGKKYGTCGILVTNDCSNGWCPVDDGQRKGWVNERFISMVSPARYCVSGVAAGDKLNLRAYPSTQSKVLLRLGRNKCEISFLPYAKGSWQKIRSSGQEGWVNRKYLSGQ